MHGDSGYGQPAYSTYPDEPDQTVGYGTPGYGSGYGTPGYGSGGYGPPRMPRRRAGLLTHIVVAVLAAALGAGVMLALYHPASSNSAAPLPGSSAVPAPATSPAGGGSPASGSEQAIVNKVEPGLVFINTSLQYNNETGAGTGMVINPDGLVLTNNHVIESSTKITATVISTGKTYPAKLVGYDKTGDISLIQLEGASGLRTIPIGDSATVKAGASVVAMGNAEGQGSIIPAAGQVTALNKTITASDEGGSVTTETLHGMIQTNADVVSGDSGGALASSAGLVIGMDTAGNNVSFQQAAATGFAIPINTALSVARQIAAGQASSTITIGYPPFVGIFIGSGSSSSPQTQAQQQNGSGNGFGGSGGFGGQGGTPSCYTSNAALPMPSTIAPVSSGSLVDGTICGSPAAAAGMTGGSVITAVNGQAVGSPDSLTSILASFRPGDTISVAWVSPSGQRTTSSLHLAAGPPQ
jgi:S1-C subfamily serine protease